MPKLKKMVEDEEANEEGIQEQQRSSNPGKASTKLIVTAV